MARKTTKGYKAARYIHVRMRTPKDPRFVKSSDGKNDFFQKTISEKDGIKARFGRLKTGGSEVQVYLFDKDKWTDADARGWVNRHTGRKGLSVKEHNMSDINFIINEIRSSLGEPLEESKKDKKDKKAKFKEVRKGWALKELEKKWSPIVADKAMADGVLTKEDVKNARPKSKGSMEDIQKRVGNALSKGKRANISDLRELIILYQI